MAAGLLTGTAIAALPAGAQSVADKQAEAERVAAELANLDDRLMDLAARFERSRFELSKVEAEVAEAQARADEAEAEVTRRQGELRDFAVRAYMGTNESSLLTADGDAILPKKMYLEVSTGNRKDLLDGLGTARAEAEEQIEHLSEVRANAERAAAETDAARAEGERAVAAQQAVNDRVQGELATLVQAEQARRAEEQRRAAEAAARATPAPARTEAPARTPAPSRPTTPAGPSPSTPPSPPRQGLSGAIEAALSKQGSGYVWGSAGPSTFDCSGLLVWAFDQVGISLPHYSGAIYNMTGRLSRGDLQPGDFVFWGPGGSDHVALYMGGNQLVHAFPSGGGVRVTQLDGWWKTPSGYGRLR